MYLLLIPNMFIVVVMVFAAVFSLTQYKKYPIAIQLLFAFFTIYLLGCSFISAYKRMFYITIPFWFIVFAYFFNVIILIRIRK